MSDEPTTIDRGPDPSVTTDTPTSNSTPGSTNHRCPCCGTPEGEAEEVFDPEALDPTQRDQELAAIAKALGHPTRAAIVRILVDRETCVCGDFVDELPYAQSTISQHLKILKDAGLICGETDGPSVCYCLVPERLDQLRYLLGSLA